MRKLISLKENFLDSMQIWLAQAGNLEVEPQAWKDALSYEEVPSK